MMQHHVKTQHSGKVVKTKSVKQSVKRGRKPKSAKNPPTPSSHSDSFESRDSLDSEFDSELDSHEEGHSEDDDEEEVHQKRQRIQAALSSAAKKRKKAKTVFNQVGSMRI